MRVNIIGIESKEEQIRGSHVSLIHKEGPLKEYDTERPMEIFLMEKVLLTEDFGARSLLICQDLHILSDIVLSHSLHNSLLNFWIINSWWRSGIKGYFNVSLNVISFELSDLPGSFQWTIFS